MREPGVHADGGEEVVVGGGQDGRHRAAGGQAGDENAAAVDGPSRGGFDKLVDERGDPCRFAGVACLVLGSEPVPAALLVVPTLLLRVDRDEPMAVGGLVHPRRGGEAGGLLCAAV